MKIKLHSPGLAGIDKHHLARWLTDMGVVVQSAFVDPNTNSARVTVEGGMEGHALIARLNSATLNGRPVRALWKRRTRPVSVAASGAPGEFKASLFDVAKIRP